MYKDDKTPSKPTERKQDLNKMEPVVDPAEDYLSRTSKKLPPAPIEVGGNEPVQTNTAVKPSNMANNNTPIYPSNIANTNPTTTQPTTTKPV